jgi:hypothetical protein
MSERKTNGWRWLDLPASKPWAQAGMACLPVARRVTS